MDPETYLKSLPAGRKEIVEQVRAIVLKNLPKGYEEQCRWGMLSYEIPLTTYPNTYNKQPLAYVALASQKNYCSLYLMGLYADKELLRWFLTEYAKTGKKLDMGKSCLRFKKVEDISLPLIGKVIRKISVKKYIELYENTR